MYEMKYIDKLHCTDKKTHRLIEAYEFHGVPFIFTKHWTGAFGFSNAQAEQVTNYLSSKFA